MQAVSDLVKKAAGSVDSLLSQAQGLSRFQVGVIAALLALLAAGAGVSVWRSRPRPVKIESGSASAREERPKLTVHVAGAVNRPGLYEVDERSRVSDAIEEAGGPAPGASLDQLNLAARLKDGQKVFVPSQQVEPPAGHGASQPSGGGTGGPVNINTAGETELETLPGVGPALAARIIEYRNSKGPFSSVDELDDVEGIGPARLESLKDLVTI
ncbi:MAG: helix-hairpin-helix domain-containing protein [Actinobacteria bacterium]|nr:helix-hairpin-helix domain-containing protein [Actinomycetota bacterium]MBU1943546.1 helix-hairpin-helix domain-containing protein [Actinomycetota bacterium]MBU2687555.1 helix-hairpin-helix domain-containing protein [Actinomycetota bacterium]